MCEKCEDRERMKEISCACSNGTKPTDIKEMNREVTDPKAEMARIEAEIQKQHQEAIKGYDHQIEECLQDLARFATKMLIMFEDYKKKGDTAGMANLLESMRNYSMMSQTDASVLTTTINMLLSKLQGIS